MRLAIIASLLMTSAVNAATINKEVEIHGNSGELTGCEFISKLLVPAN